MYFGGEGREYVDERIHTADDYIDDDEEEAAQILKKDRYSPNNQASESEIE